MLTSLAGKVAVVTGGEGVLCRAMALSLAAQGVKSAALDCKVLIGDRAGAHAPNATMLHGRRQCFPGPGTRTMLSKRLRGAYHGHCLVPEERILFKG